MPRPPKLTNSQKSALHRLEPKLRDAVRKRDFDSAKACVNELQSILRPTGHETRLMQAKNWLFEAAMECGRIEFATSGFLGIRGKTKSNTRVNLEATALLAICYLRQNDLERAKELMSKTLRNDTVIKSESRRREFRTRVVRRFEEEMTLATLKGVGRDTLDVSSIQREAGRFVETKTEDQLLETIGANAPPETLRLLREVNEIARNQLPPRDLKFLPSPESFTQNADLGRTIFSSLKRVLWRSLCDPNSEVYKSWFNEGFKTVLNRRYMSAAVVATLLDLGLGLKALTVAIVALIIKIGLEVFCDRYAPEGIML